MVQLDKNFFLHFGSHASLKYHTVAQNLILHVRKFDEVFSFRREFKPFNGFLFQPHNTSENLREKLNGNEWVKEYYVIVRSQYLILVTFTSH